MPVETIRWDADALYIIDQTLLPEDLREIELPRVEDVWHAIKTLKVRGAPAIGVCAAFGLVVSLREKQPRSAADLRRVVGDAADYLATSRPTAVNLFWALDRMRRVLDRSADDASLEELTTLLDNEALEIFNEDKVLCRAIGEHGAPLIEEGHGVLTHCNAGGLATADYGTALAVFFRAHEEGRRFQAYADETRPLLQGARLTAWELQKAGIDVTLICDSMAAQVMREGKIQLVIVGADRIAANGDAANKIGTYGVALLAHAHDIPFYVAAPTSTIDRDISTGDDIPIEQRDSREITHWNGRPSAPEGINVYNPAFDVTPAKLIAGIVTEHGILRPPYRESIAEAMDSPNASAAL